MNIVSKGFGGIDRSKSTFDKNFRSAEVAKDVELFPTGRLLGRAGYLALYKSDVIYPLNPMGQGEERDQPAVLPTSDTNYDSVVGTPETGGVHLGDAGGDDIRIVAIYEWEQPDYGGGTTQRHVIQCSNNLFYRYHFGLHPGWVVLENTYQNDLGVTEWFWERLRPVLTRGGMAITSRPIPSPHAHFWDSKGVLRMGLGTGAKAIPLWYGRIDRKFFTSLVNYNNWHLDVTPLQSPISTAIARNSNAPYNKRYTAITTLNAGIGAYDIKNYIVCFNGVGAVDDDDYVHWLKFLYNTVNNDDRENFDIGWAPGVKPIDGFIYGEKDLMYFYVGISYIYDNSQESQIYIATDNDIDTSSQIGSRADKPNLVIPNTVCIGSTRNANGVGFAESVYVAATLKLWKPTDTTIGADDYPQRVNPRVTSIRVWLGTLLTKEQTPEETNFYPVKSVIVSQEDDFKEEIWSGNSAWVIGDASIYLPDITAYYFACPIGANDWLAGLEAGDYRKINGHSFPLIDDTFGLQRSPFLEGYSYAKEIADRIVYGDVRWDGQVRKNDIIRSAVFSDAGSFGNMPDVIDGSPVQLDSEVQGLVKLDNTTLCIVENTQVEKRSMPNLILNKTSEGGCSAHDSIIEINNAILFFKDGEQYYYDGVRDPMVVSDGYSRDSDDGTYKGLISTFDNTNVWSFYLPTLRKQLIFCKHTDENTWHAFVYDYRTRKQMEYQFAHIVGSTIATIVRSFVAGCTGVDGEMDFTDGIYIYRFPLGIHDDGVAIDPIYQYSDVEFPPRMETTLNDLYLNHKSTQSDAVLIPAEVRLTIRRDRNDLTAITKDFPTTTENLAKVTKPFLLGTRAEKCLSIKFSLTTPNITSLMHIESVAVTTTDQGTI